MNKLLLIARHEFVVTVRRGSYIFLTLFFPLLGLAGLLGFELLQGRTLNIGAGEHKFGYVDETGQFTQFTRQGKVSFIPFATVEEAKAALLKGDVEKAYVVPGDYIAVGRVAELTTRRGLEMTKDAHRPLEEFLMANLLGGRTPPEVAERVKAPAAVEVVTLDAVGEPLNTGLHLGRLLFFAPLMVLLMVAIFTSSGFLLYGLGEEKENRVMEILLSSVSPIQLMVGKILGLGAAGLLQVAIWAVAGLATLGLGASRIGQLSGLALPGPVAFVGILYFILGYLLYATVMAALGAVTTTVRESQQISGIVVMPAILPIYLWNFVLNSPEGVLSRFLTFFPLTAPFAVMQRLSVEGIRAWEVVASVVALGASIVVMMWLTARLFRAYLLMYGKRPSLGQIWRTLRQA